MINKSKSEEVLSAAKVKNSPLILVQFKDSCEILEFIIHA